MKISLNWLRQYVDIDIRPADLADKLTMAGFEVEAIINPYGHLSGVVVGRINSIKAHPNADKLASCTVDTGDRILSIVCGAPNIETGMTVPCVLPGTLLPSGTYVENSRIRGELSEGMLCSAAELDLGPNSSGVMVLDSALEPGLPLSEALGLNDTVLEIGLTPNRPDCLSIIGVARETAALLGKTLKRPDVFLPVGHGRITEMTSVTIEAPELCPRYAARLVTGITIAESPDWLKKRLVAIGLKPINNIVDITNFVMMETGQPLHAFDFDRLAGNRIIVRTPVEEKTFTTLDGKSRHLEADMLLICDAEKPVAVAGVMGGENSEIAGTTSRVLIESACFNPVSIRKTAKRMGLATDASHRFERGVDPDGTIRAVDRAALLMAEFGGGTLVDGLIDENPIPSPLKKIHLSITLLNRHLGTRLNREAIAGYLRSIEFSVTEDDPDTLSVIPPSFRVDVQRPEDLMEEVARLWGYNNIGTTFPRLSARTEPPKRGIEIKSNIRDLMAAFGFNETVNYSFTGINVAERLEIAKGDIRGNELPILNPLSETQAVMRTSLMASLLDAMQKNIFRQERDLKLFELGKVFFSNGPDRLPDETEILAGLWTGTRRASGWLEKPVPCDFYDLKGVVEALFTALGISGATFSRVPDAACSFTRPGHTAQIQYGQSDLGLVGEIKPSVLKRFDLKQSAFCFEINVNALIENLPDDISFAPIPRFPMVSRDLTLIVANRVEAGDILQAVKELGIDLVERVSIYDLYRGKPIPEEKKSITIRTIYRSHEETLEDERVNAVHQTITDHLLNRFAASLPA